MARDKQRNARGGSAEARRPGDPGSGGVSRRDFLKGASLGGSGVAAAFLSAPSGNAAVVPRSEVAKALDDTGVFSKENHLERQREELQRALARPLDERKWVMVIDLQKCVGCEACTVACVAENNLPPGVAYRPVLQEELGVFPRVRREFVPRPCMHCDEPPCIQACPVEATFKQEDSAVVVDYERCIGCRYCISACPYGARYFDQGEYYGEGTPEIMDYETRPSPEYGEKWLRATDAASVPPKGTVRKCQFCGHRTTEGMLPSCVTTCLGGATFFGDFNDEKSLVRELIGSERVMRLMEEFGTEPSVYYLV